LLKNLRISSITAGKKKSNFFCNFFSSDAFVVIEGAEMNCRDYQKLISARVDGEISGDDIELLKLHLDHCSVCRRVESGFSMVNNIHRGIEDDEVPEELLLSLYRERDAEKKPVFVKFLRGAAVAAVLAAVIAAGAGIGGFLASGSYSGDREVSGEVLNVEYLHAYPPGSTGELIVDTVGKGDRYAPE
jgi:hypothetical protein